MTDLDEIFDVQEETPAAEAPEYEPYSKEEWLKHKDENRREAFELLETATTELTEPGKLTQYLDVQSRFDRYSVSNALLIAHQKPEATRIADAKTWQKNGEYIKKVIRVEEEAFGKTIDTGLTILEDYVTDMKTDSGLVLVDEIEATHIGCEYGEYGE